MIKKIAFAQYLCSFQRVKCTYLIVSNAVTHLSTIIDSSALAVKSDFFVKIVRESDKGRAVPDAGQQILATLGITVAYYTRRPIMLVFVVKYYNKSAIDRD